VWPSLSALLEVDHPARRAAGVTAAESERGAISTSTSTGCARYVIETSSRCISAFLRSGAWGWGRAEREICAPHAPTAFWKAAGPPYRALALRMYSRLKARFISHWSPYDRVGVVNAVP
jgi:hypothetical protein